MKKWPRKKYYGWPDKETPLSRKLKKVADQSGDPKVWTADRFSQDFLKSLIPGRI
jgi:hypothetical protein